MVPRTSQCSGIPATAGAMMADSILTSVPKGVAIRSEHVIMGRPNDGDLDPRAKAITIVIFFMAVPSLDPNTPESKRLVRSAATLAIVPDFVHRIAVSAVK